MLKKIIPMIIKIIIVTATLMIASCIENMMIRMSIVFVLYSFIIFRTIKNKGGINW